MSNGYRNGAFALGVVTGGGLALNLFLWLDFKGQDPRDQGTQPDKENHYSKVGEWWDSVIGTFVSPSDTLAQWIMAIFTVVAVVLLWRTLRQTDRTNQAAVAAAEAAHEANRIMRDEQRAWVAVDFQAGPTISYQPNSNSLMLSVKVSPQNLGNTPAINMYVGGGMKIVPKGDKEGIGSSDYTDLIKKTIQKAQDGAVKGQMTETLFQGRPAALWKNGHYIHAHLREVRKEDMECACIALCVAVCYKIPSGFGFAVCHGIVVKDGPISIFSDMAKSAVNHPVKVQVIWNPVAYT